MRRRLMPSGTEGGRKHPTRTPWRAHSACAATACGAGEGIALRKLDRRNDHEVELVFIIGKTARGVRKDEALDYVAGYAIGLDITIRGPEERSLRKSADSYAILDTSGGDYFPAFRPEPCGQRPDAPAIQHQQPDSRRA